MRTIKPYQKLCVISKDLGGKMDIQIHEATPEDKKLAAVIRVVINSIPCFSDHIEAQRWTRSFVKSLLANPAYFILVAEIKQELVGFVIGSILAGVYNLEWIGVLPIHRKKGIGKGLIARLEIILSQRKVRKIWCTVLDEDRQCQENQAFFREVGFKKMCQLGPHWYGYNCSLWQKCLN